MKKQLSICVLVLCIVLSGCRGPVEPITPETGVQNPVLGYDAQNKYMTALGSVVCFQEAEDFYFGNTFMGNLLRYYDKASGISGVLCADPSCTHNSKTCGGYAETGTVFYGGDDKIYWISKDQSSGDPDYYLWTSDLSGTNRKQLNRISYADTMMVFQPQQYVLHQEKLYIIGKSHLLEGTEGSVRVTILAAPLSESAEYTMLFDETFDRSVQQTVRFIGDDVYLSLLVFSTGKPFDLKILKIDTQSGAKETVYEETGMAGAVGQFWVTPAGEIYFPGIDGETSCVWKIENGKRVLIASWPGNTSDAYIREEIMVQTSKTDGVRYVSIVDFEGESIYEGEMFPEGIPGINSDPNAASLALIGGDSEKLILNLMYMGEAQGMASYTVMLDLTDDLKPTILWGGQE